MHVCNFAAAHRPSRARPRHSGSEKSWPHRPAESVSSRRNRPGGHSSLSSSSTAASSGIDTEAKGSPERAPTHCTSETLFVRPLPTDSRQDVDVQVQEARHRVFHQHPDHPRPLEAQGLRGRRAREVPSLLLLLLSKTGRDRAPLTGEPPCAQKKTNRQALRYIIRNTTLPARTRAMAQLQLTQMHCYTRPTQIRNRCILGGKGRGIFSDFKMSRVRWPAIPCSSRGVWGGGGGGEGRDVDGLRLADMFVHSTTSGCKRSRATCPA